MSAVESEGSRTAFELNAVHQRRDQSHVMSVGVDGDGQRLYVGLNVGVVEEHRLMQTPSGIVARFSARRSVSKKVRLRISGGRSEAINDHGGCIVQ